MINRKSITKEWLTKEYTNSRRSTRDLAEEIDCNCFTIQKRLHELNIPVRKAWDWKALNVDDEWLHEQYFIKNQSAASLAKDLGTYTSSIIHRLRNMGLETRTSKEASALRNHHGRNNPSWNGGKSFEPYCHKFNYDLKEKIRNQNNRNCVLCGKWEILNGKKLSIHHIDGNKMQGCNTKKWHLTSLCNSCNSLKDTVEKEFLIITNMEVKI